MSLLRRFWKWWTMPVPYTGGLPGEPDVPWIDEDEA